MKGFKEKYGDWAILIGAAEGIGEAFAIQLASQGFNLIMLDKNEASLIALSEKLIKEYNIQIKNLHLDLIDPNATKIVIQAIADLKCRLLIYNAAFSLIKKFTDHSTEELDIYLQVNVTSQLKLIHSFSNYLKEKKQNGGILLMSSLAGLLGMQYIAPYAASKAFTWNLAESLFHELKPYNIDVCACIAGATLSQTYINTRPKYGMIKPQLQKPEVVAKNALAKLGEKAFFISGRSNRINYFVLTRLLPRKMAGQIANRAIKKMYDYV